ncbi:MAG: hypothetical protein J7639_16095 [Paenibacillaceae bacterium]|nr:hypothetical protein [Paenibacillaceae bacterium]
MKSFRRRRCTAFEPASVEAFSTVLPYSDNIQKHAPHGASSAEKSDTLRALPSIGQLESAGKILFTYVQYYNMLYENSIIQHKIWCIEHEKVDLPRLGPVFAALSAIISANRCFSSIDKHKKRQCSTWNTIPAL